MYRWFAVSISDCPNMIILCLSVSDSNKSIVEHKIRLSKNFVLFWLYYDTCLSNVNYKLFVQNRWGFFTDVNTENGKKYASFLTSCEFFLCYIHKKNCTVYGDVAVNNATHWKYYTKFVAGGFLFNYVPCSTSWG